ncbi:MAG TPA: hypothetical protein VGJ84_05010 [Polyangiaceae bacterium]
MRNEVLKKWLLVGALALFACGGEGPHEHDNAATVRQAVLEGATDITSNFAPLLPSHESETAGVLDARGIPWFGYNAGDPKKMFEDPVAETQCVSTQA